MGKKARFELRIGVVGLGYWGPNLVRTIFQTPGARVAMVCDKDGRRLKNIQRLYDVPTGDYEEMLDVVEAVVIATPFLTHFELAKKALLAGKHVLIEKPFVKTLAEAEELSTLAGKNRVVMVDHTFEYSAAVMDIRRRLTKGELGEVYAVEMRRMNLGLFQQDHNVVWDLAYHDVAILHYLFDDLPSGVIGVGGAHIQPGIEDSAYAILTYTNGRQAMMHLSWLHPEKVRQVTIVGSKKMLVFDDLQTMEKLKIWDKGVAVERARLPKMAHYDSWGEFSYLYRHGDVYIPRLEQREPLMGVVEEFVAAVKEGRQPRSGIAEATTVIRVVGAIEASVKLGGKKVKVEPSST